MKFTDKDAELAYWKAAAIYFADCHAATAANLDEIIKKPKAEASRLLHIAGVCALILEGEDDAAIAREAPGFRYAGPVKCATPRIDDTRGRDRECERVRVIERLRTALED